MQLLSYKLFKDSLIITISYREIASLYNISPNKAKAMIAKDVKHWMLFKRHIPYKKNSYCLTPMGLDILRNKA